MFFLWFQISSGISISSENLSLIAVLAEVVCSCVLEWTKRIYLKNDDRKAASFISHWFKNPQIVSSSDSTVTVYVVPRKNGDVGRSNSSNEYRLQIIGKSFKDLKLEGWKRLPDDRWEILLTHSQMVFFFIILCKIYV